MRRLATIALAAAALGITTGGSVAGASASQLVDRNATGVHLQLNAKGEALLTYESKGVFHHVLAWGAVNALPSTVGGRQLKLRLDYSGGYEKYFKENPAALALRAEYRKIKGTRGYLLSPVVRQLQQTQQAADTYWQTAFHGGCRAYTGPAIAWAVLTCTAPDGSYWAVQQWQRELPDYGVTPTAAQAVQELRLSHWTGPLPVLTVHTDWSWRHWNHLYGTLAYADDPVYGFSSTTAGNPLDGFGRNVYIDTFDSAYGAGWKRENSALTHRGTGVFCYSVNPHPGHPAGTGTAYRVTVIGPGLTPDVEWIGSAPGPYDAVADAAANAQIAALGDSVCRPN
ncbi:MAG TPA: hypothetical protein VH063_04325 [Gaiellaceae bacterium]|jgi:hypothetical protein|nr:hypothetical protein [Gaiellaceae bacterium]